MPDDQATNKASRRFSPAEIKRFYDIVGATGSCEVCGSTRFEQTDPTAADTWPGGVRKPDFYYIGTTDQSGAAKDYAVLPVVMVMCKQCGNLRQHVLGFVEQTLASADRKDG